MEESIVENGIVASDESQLEYLWLIRESVTAALTEEGYVYKYDLSLPYENFYEIVEELKKRLPESMAKVYAYGHIGDGRFYLQIFYN